MVDGTSLCYRSFFAINISTSSGFSSGAVYGVYRTLKKLISKYQPLYMAVCFDVSRKTFRQEKFKEYKIQRPPTPKGLTAQIPIVKKLVTSLGIEILEKEGFEADDVIASLCQKATSDGLEVVIVSSDKDFQQLIEKGKVTIYNYNQDRLIDRDIFLKENGFEPKYMTDYLSLVGDNADNIPGAKGIGKVGAAKLIKEFKDIDNIFSNLDKLPEKTRKILKKNKKNIILSNELVNLHFPKLSLSWQNLKIKEPKLSSLQEIFSELEFKSFLKDISSASSDLDVEIKEGLSEEGLKKIAKNRVFFFLKDKSIFIADPKKDWIYKLGVLEAKDILENEKVEKVTYDLKNQLLSLKGINIKGVVFDIKIAAYLIDSGFNDYEIVTLASKYLNKHFSELHFSTYPYFILQLYELLVTKLKEEKLNKLFYDVEMPLIYVLRDMQLVGIKVDADTLSSLSTEVTKRTEDIKKKIFKLANREFNLNSPKQLRGVLFDELKIKPVKKTKTGYSTNEEVLSKLSVQYPIAKYILEYRYLNKLKTTYITPLIEEVEKNKGMLHTQFNQTGTQTGRLSSSSPNLQSIPIKGEFSVYLRKGFLPSREGGHILSGDYSQIELRILAHLSGDKRLIKAFSDDLDIHRTTASLLFGVKDSQIDEEQRNIAKRVNFGIIYGMSSYGLSKELKISPHEAQNFIDDYFKRYADVKKYIDRVHEQVQAQGFVSTILGRKRRLPDINSPNIQLREFSRRQATNAPIQGSCADLTKVAMVRAFDKFNELKLKTKLIIQIHDELVFDVYPGELEAVKKIVRECMEEAIDLSVPIKVNLKVGLNWGEMKGL